MLCKFLLYDEENQLYVCIHPPHLGPPSYPPQSHPSRSSQNTDLETRIYTREKTVSSISGSGKLDSVQFSSVAQSCPTLCDPMNHSTPGLPVHHQLPEFTQTQVHRVGDAIQPSHSLSSPSPPAPNPSQHQDLFQ